MSSKLYKILLILGIAIALLAIPIFSLSYNPPQELEVNFLDIGQGDAILIKTPFGQNILIDGGPGNTIIKRLSENLAFWDKRIDLMILTHPHDDHVTGLIEIIKRYRVKRILYTGVVHSAPNYLAWLETVKERKIPLVIIDRPQTIKLGKECYLDILYPKESLLGREVGNLNNTSMVVKLVCKGNKFLFMGDAEIEAEEELLNNNVDLSVDVLKVGHHGSDTSSDQEFLRIVAPKIAVIQVGKDNDFGHPSRRVIKRLERIGAEIFRNDLEGTIKIVSKGEEIFVLRD